jgi:hypothetical protein
MYGDCEIGVEEYGGELIIDLSNESIFIIEVIPRCFIFEVETLL